jgi:hypothetical protein
MSSSSDAVDCELDSQHEGNALRGLTVSRIDLHYQAAKTVCESLSKYSAYRGFIPTGIQPNIVIEITSSIKD